MNVARRIAALLFFLALARGAPSHAALIPLDENPGEACASQSQSPTAIAGRGNRDDYDADKPGRKKQGRENNQKKKQKGNWKYRTPPREPPRHTPGKEHRRNG